MSRIGLNAHLLSRRQSYRGAGVSHYIASLLQHLPRVDGGVSYHAFLPPGSVRPDGWQVHTSLWDTEKPTARIVWEQAAQPLAVRRVGLDLLHEPVYAGPLLKPCPMIVTVHDLSFYRFPELLPPFNRIYLQRITRATVSRAEVVIAVSEATRRELIEILGADPDRVITVPNGVDPCMRPASDPAALAALRRRYRLPEHFVLFLGTLEPRKNLTTLVEAYSLLVQRHGLPHTLVIAGGQGWYYEEIEKAVQRLGLQGKVLFPGFVPQEELPLWYSAAELFVYPSLYEGFGLPPLEAMACGTPVITSNTSSLPEVVADAGRCLPPEEAESMAESMAELLQDASLRQTLIQRGLERARQYTWERTAKRTAQLYHQVLGDGYGATT